MDTVSRPNVPTTGVVSPSESEASGGTSHSKSDEEVIADLAQSPLSQSVDIDFTHKIATIGTETKPSELIFAPTVTSGPDGISIIAQKHQECKAAIMEKLAPSLEQLPRAPQGSMKNDIVDGEGVIVREGIVSMDPEKHVAFAIKDVYIPNPDPATPLDADDIAAFQIGYIKDAECARALALNQVCEAAKDSFIADMEGLATLAGGRFEGGTDNTFVVKSEESAMRKVEIRVTGEDISKLAGEPFSLSTHITGDVSCPSYVEVMGDMLRGTIVVDNYDQMSSVVDALSAKATTDGWSVTVENKFSEVETRPYVGLHFNIGYSSPNGTIITELQVHTRRNLQVKELDHKIYEIVRELPKGDSQVKVLQASQRILYTAAMAADLQGI